MNIITGVGGDSDDGVDSGRKFRETEVVHRPGGDERLKRKVTGFRDANILKNRKLT